MGRIFTLDDDIRSIAQDALDDLLDQLGKTCTLVFPPIFSDCPDCTNIPQAGRPQNHWITGGHAPISEMTTCALCGGTHKQATYPTDTVKLLITWDLRKFYGMDKEAGNVPIPNGAIKTRGYLTDLPKILACDHMYLQKSLGNPRMKFEKLPDVADTSNIVQGRYFYMTWKRIP